MRLIRLLTWLGAVQLIPTATTCGLPANRAAHSSSGVPSLMRSPSLHEKLTQALTAGVSSSRRAIARASAKEGMVSHASRSAQLSASTSQRGRCHS